jgi:hypothetical protein
MSWELFRAKGIFSLRWGNIPGKIRKIQKIGADAERKHIGRLPKWADEEKVHEPITRLSTV